MMHFAWLWSFKGQGLQHIFITIDAKKKSKGFFITISTFIMINYGCKTRPYDEKKEGTSNFNIASG